MKLQIVKPRTQGRTIGFVFSLICLICISKPIAIGSSSDVVNSNPEVITFIVGESTIVRSPWPSGRVAVTDPTIANVEILTPEQVLLQGFNVGSTDLIVWSEDETQVQQWKVNVKLDTARFKEKLDELFPDASLQVSESGETLIVTGLLHSSEQAKQLHDFLDKSGVTYVDMTSVAGVQQVLLEVRIAEASRTALRSLGINTFYTDDDFFAGSVLGNLANISIGFPEGQLVGDPIPFQFMRDTLPGSSVTLFAGVPSADFEIFIQALAENQYVRLLANPTLVALSGEEASFLAGGEFPIPVVQGGTGGGGGNSVTIEYREYGVRVSFKPTVLGDGTIRLHAAPEVSTLSDAGAVIISGFRVPSLVTRKAATTLELKSGETFAMAGLLKDTTEALNSRVPGLGDLPVLGPLFRSVRYQKNETE
ncbi:MAG: type II and III secretion system protein family protein, partial [Planctomycetota bacterium]